MFLLLRGGLLVPGLPIALGQGEAYFPALFSGTALPSGFAVFSGLAVCAGWPPPSTLGAIRSSSSSIFRLIVPTVLHILSLFFSSFISNRRCWVPSLVGEAAGVPAASPMTQMQLTDTLRGF